MCQLLRVKSFPSLRLEQNRDDDENTQPVRRSFLFPAVGSRQVRRESIGFDWVGMTRY
jgi:hypothetical protein